MQSNYNSHVLPAGMQNGLATLENSLAVSFRSNQSILKEIGPGYSLEGLMLKAAILWPPGVKS